MAMAAEVVAGYILYLVAGAWFWLALVVSVHFVACLEKCKINPGMCDNTYSTYLDLYSLT